MNNFEKLKLACENFTVLYVEDEDKLREKVWIYLSKFFKKVDEASNGEEGLEKYKNSHYDIVMTDISMPKLNGLQMSQKIKEIEKYQKIIIISAYSDTENFIESIKIGVDGYILKPFRYEQMNEVLYKTTNDLIRAKENEMFKEKLLQLVEIKTQETKELALEKTQNYKDTLYTLVDLIEQRDTYTGGHSNRVAKYCQLIAKQLKLQKQKIEDIYEAGILHDVGKIAIPDTVLLKPGKLTDIEYSLIQKHVDIGYKILKKSPMFKKIANIIKQHHERIDGSGYPDGLKGDEISLCGKIMAVADSFDAMTTSRIYQAKKTPNEALEEIKSLVGSSFDKRVVDAVLIALKNVKVEQKTDQTPLSEMEKERFSYFYKDQLTQVYNANYLDLILNQNIFTHYYQKIHVIFLKNFNGYNKKHGWRGGNVFLQKVSEKLSKNYVNNLVFRIHGDDFVVLGPQNVDFKDIYKLCAKSSMDCSHDEINLDKENINSLNSLEAFIGE